MTNLLFILLDGVVKKPDEAPGKSDDVERY